MSMLFVFTVLAKWVLASTVREGAFEATLYTEYRRWLLGKLAFLVEGYYLGLILGRQTSVHNTFCRLLGMKIGRQTVMSNRLSVHPEDAHLVELGSQTLMSVAELVPYHTGRCNSATAKCRITVGDNSLIGMRARVEGSVKIEDNCTVGYMTHIEGGGLPGEEGGEEEQRVIKSGSLCVANSVMKRMKPKGNGEGAEGSSSSSIYPLLVVFDTILLLIRLGTRYLTVWAAFEIGIEISEATGAKEEAAVVLWGGYIFIW
eukprot:jgi/Bigna1/140136/aug1.54_g14844